MCQVDEVAKVNISTQLFISVLKLRARMGSFSAGVGVLIINRKQDLDILFHSYTDHPLLHTCLQVYESGTSTIDKLAHPMHAHLVCHIG